MKEKVHFLWSANSCRSHIAPALVNAPLAHAWRAFGAGSRPAAYLHPKTIQVLAEVGINHAGWSKSADEFLRERFGRLLSACASGAGQCLVWLPVPRPREMAGRARQVHHAFPGPLAAEKMENFRRLRGFMLRQITPLLEHHAD